MVQPTIMFYFQLYVINMTYGSKGKVDDNMHLKKIDLFLLRHVPV